MTPLLPSILLPWRPAEVVRLTTDLIEGDPWVIAGTLADTKPGERSLVYQTTSDQGVVAVIDFARAGSKHPELGYASWGVWKTLSVPISRAELLAIDRSTFLRPQGRRRIPEPTRHKLAGLLGETRESMLEGQGIPAYAAADIEWVPADLEETWGIEAAMRDAIASHEPAWQRLGFAAAPATEVNVPGSRDRMDIAAPDAAVVVECKLHAGIASVTQIDRYVDGLRANGREVGRMHLVAARSYSREVAAVVGGRADVELWICTRQPDGSPLLTRVC